MILAAVYELEGTGENGTPAVAAFSLLNPRVKPPKADHDEEYDDD
jgi:hypothetical protein